MPLPARCLMRGLLGIVGLLFISPTVQAQDLNWALRAGGGGMDNPSGLVSDAAGHTTVTGSFDATATFGAGTPNETTLTSADAADLFVARYDPAGRLQWAKRAGGPAGDQAFALALDAAGNSYVTGFFEETLTFGTGEPNENTLTSTGSRDLFLAKYDPTGVVQWAKSAGGPASNDHATAIVCDASGSFYLTGFFNDTATLGVGEANEVTLRSAGGFDLFIARYTTDGVLQWAKAAGGPLFDAGLGIGADASGNSYLTGYFEDTATFEAGEDAETTRTSAGERDLFLASYSPDGALRWVRQASSVANAQPFGLGVDATGHSYITGFFEETLTLGAGTPQEIALTSAGAADLFVARYDPDGVLRWATGTGGTGSDQGMALAVDVLGNSFVTGHFEDTVTFGAGTPNETVLTSRGGSDVFVAGFDPAGFLLWADGFGGRTGNQGQGDQGTGIGVDRLGNAYVTGFFGGTATLGAGTPNETVLTSAGVADLFVARYGTGTPIDTEQPAVPTDEWILAPNYPNPFRGSTTLSYRLPHPGPVRLLVYDALGRHVRVLVDARQPAGSHQVVFQAGRLPPGPYIAQLQTPTFTTAQVLLLIN